MNIDRLALVEYETHKFVTNASDIELAPGEWPETLEVSPSMGNGQPLVKYLVREDGARVYVQTFGCVSVCVLNS